MEIPFEWKTGGADPGTTRLTTLSAAALHDAVAWNHLVRLYGPLIYSWCRRMGCQPSDARDLTQDVFVVVLRKLDQLRRDRPGAHFRPWLKTITKNKVVDLFRKKRPEAVGGTAFGESLQQLRCVSSDDLDAADHDHQQVLDQNAVLARAMELIRDDFQSHTWLAFWRTAVQGEGTADVARQLGMNENAVRQSKFRVIRRIRTVFEDLIDLDSIA
ncbi:MAG: sigma-70 family RNA polymerase sigma factor [Planctomycetota bacterium]